MRDRPPLWSPPSRGPPSRKGDLMPTPSIPTSLRGPAVSSSILSSQMSPYLMSFGRSQAPARPTVYRGPPEGTPKSQQPSRRGLLLSGYFKSHGLVASSGEKAYLWLEQNREWTREALLTSSVGWEGDAALCTAIWCGGRAREFHERRDLRKPIIMLLRSSD